MNNPYPSAPEGAMNINDRFAGAYDAAGFGGVDLNLNAIRAAIIRNRWILIGWTNPAGTTAISKPR